MAIINRALEPFESGKMDNLLFKCHVDDAKDGSGVSGNVTLGKKSVMKFRTDVLFRLPRMCFAMITFISV